MNETVRRAGERAAEALARLESTFKPGRYKLTFVARYVGPDGLQLDLELVAPVSKPETPREGGEGALAERFFPKARGTT